MRQANVRAFACVVFFWLMISGCSTANPAPQTVSGNSTAPLSTPTPAPESNSETKTGTDTWQQHGPYIRLLTMSDEQALAALGKPSKESEKEGQLSWEYPNLGLTVVINKQRVFYVVQTRGNITDSLSIGDSEKNAVALTKHELEPDVFDREAKVGRAYLSDVDVVVTVKNGEVVKAELMLPGGDN